MNNDLYLKYIDIIIPDNKYQIINMNKLETSTTNIKLNEILKILVKNQEIKLNSYFETIIKKDSYKKQAHNFNFCKICKCSINDISYYIVKTIKKEAVFINEILKKFEKACLEYSIQISSFDDVKKHLKKMKNKINEDVQKINNLIKKLNNIALYSNIYENQENYCDYQIKIKKYQDKKMRSYKLGRLFRNQNVFDNKLNEHLSILSNSMKSIFIQIFEN